MIDDILTAKAAIIERCLKRIADEYKGHESELATNYTRQDSIILNLQRACEAAIDMGLRIIRLKGLGLPQSGRDVFVILGQTGLIPEALSNSLQAMVGFRNIAVHNYTEINIDIVRHVLDQKLDDLLLFSSTLLKFE